MDVQHAKKYHQAAQHDPEEIYRENAQVELPRPEPKEPSYKVFSLEDYLNGTMEEWEEKMLNALIPDYKVRDFTWRERAEDLKKRILGPLVNPKEIGYLEMERSVAKAIQERLVNEIPAEGFIEMSKECLHYVANYRDELEPDDLTLIK